MHDPACLLYKLAPGADAQQTVDNVTASKNAPAGRWDYGVVCDFDSLADLQTYNTHPVHVEAVKALLPMLAAHTAISHSSRRKRNSHGM